ncbi:hypothetical protein OsJ_07603 [Oryza sativa Japonica Group]|uniref:Uncharacterized protein n=1 Tax=Oryza sativa subsp. japonica TaxID=39947 RepID=B9F170_ORYSJ|nr:hypothetical protein OsJ_07603 [Oryza sativa Japonica Group]
MRQAKCRQDYMAIVKQSRQLIEKLDAKNEPKKRQKRSKNSEKEKAVAPSSSKKMDREELEKTIRGFLKELDSTEAAPMRTTGFLPLLKLDMFVDIELRRDTLNTLCATYDGIQRLSHHREWVDVAE